jgi:hypothetical protein
MKENGEKETRRRGSSFTTVDIFYSDDFSDTSYCHTTACGCILTFI